MGQHAPGAGDLGAPFNQGIIILSIRGGLGGSGLDCRAAEHSLNLPPWASGDTSSTIVSVSFPSTLGSPTVEPSES